MESFLPRTVCNGSPVHLAQRELINTPETMLLMARGEQHVVWEELDALWDTTGHSESMVPFSS